MFDILLLLLLPRRPKHTCVHNTPIHPGRKSRGPRFHEETEEPGGKGPTQRPGEGKGEPQPRAASRLRFLVLEAAVRGGQWVQTPSLAGEEGIISAVCFCIVF